MTPAKTHSNQLGHTARRRMWRKLRDDRGQGMTEYIIIVALVSIVCIGVVSKFGNNVRQLFGMSATALAGEQVNKTTRSVDANQEKTLQNFHDVSQP